MTFRRLNNCICVICLHVSSRKSGVCLLSLNYKLKIQSVDKKEFNVSMFHIEQMTSKRTFFIVLQFSGDGFRKYDIQF